MSYGYYDDEENEPGELEAYLRKALMHSLNIHITLQEHNKDYMTKKEFKKEQELYKEGVDFLDRYFGKRD